MTQIVVTLENGADSSFLQRMIENMKGVLTTIVREKSDHSKEATSEWIKKMENLSNTVDSSRIDMTDERTRYLMSK